MDINIQIQGIKTELDNMKLLIENIEMQNNNIMNPMMMNNSLGDQMLNLSIQMFNTGLLTFKSGKNISMNSNKYFDKLKKISDDINEMINSHNIQIQQQMIQQQMIQQQMMQQQMMQQQIMQQQMMQQQINLNKKVNIIFEGNRIKKFCLPISPFITIKDLCDQFKERIEKDNGLTNPLKNEEFILIYNSISIDKNSQKLVKDYFNYNLNAPGVFPILIKVLFYK